MACCRVGLQQRTGRQIPEELQRERGQFGSGTNAKAPTGIGVIATVFSAVAIVYLAKVSLVIGTLGTIFRAGLYVYPTTGKAPLDTALMRLLSSPRQSKPPEQSCDPRGHMIGASGVGVTPDARPVQHAARPGDPLRKLVLHRSGATWSAQTLPPPIDPDLVQSRRREAPLTGTEQGNELNQTHGSDNVENYYDDPNSNVQVLLVKLMQSVERV